MQVRQYSEVTIKLQPRKIHLTIMLIEWSYFKIRAVKFCAAAYIIVRVTRVKFNKGDKRFFLVIIVELIAIIHCRIF